VVKVQAKLQVALETEKGEQGSGRADGVEVRRMVGTRMKAALVPIRASEKGMKDLVEKQMFVRDLAGTPKYG
jgi:hypothetical protein